MSIPTPKPTSDPYGPLVAQVNAPPLSSSSAVYAPVSTTTSTDIIHANMNAANEQNNLNATNSGRVTGGYKRRSHKRSAHKRSAHKRSAHKRSAHKRSAHKRSATYKRARYGGEPTPTPTPTPTTTVPQFGSLHSGANAASINLNSGAMSQSAQAKYDDPNAPASNTYFQ